MIADMRHSQFAGTYVKPDSVYSTTLSDRIVIEEALVLSRNKYSLSFNSGADIADVNGPEDSKGQNFWDGTYTVRLKRQGLVLGRVYTMSEIGRGSQDQYVYAPYEEVSLTWLNRDNVQIPVIIGGNTLDNFNKSLSGNSHLVDFGERVIRSAIARNPGKPDSPFAHNQFDNPNSAPKTPQGNDYDENNDSVVKNPGAEIFLDKFGRVLSLSRQDSNEFMVTYGKIDSGQDDISSLISVSAQDSYYAAIKSDESKPLTSDFSEPMAPKSINIRQYQPIKKTGKLAGDDPNSGFGFGVLPRFDKWRFIPVIIRAYDGGDGSESEVQSVFNERSNSLYSRTITNSGDIKIYSPGNSNTRIIGDILLSVGGNIQTKIKTSDRLSSGSTNPENIYHQELLNDGTIRVRSNQNTSLGTENFFSEVNSEGSIDMYCKSGGGTSSNYSFRTTVDSSNGAWEVDGKDLIKISAGSDINIEGQTLANIITVNGTTIGSNGSAMDAEAFVKGNTLKTYLDSLVQVLNTWVFVPADGGASLKMAITAWVASVHTAISTGNLYLSQQNSSNANKVN